MSESQSHSHRYPDFYKVYVPDHSSQRLYIPPSFTAFFTAQTLPKSTILRSRRGGSLWHVEVSQTEQGVFFQNGWHNFVTDNSLELGDLLTFRFDGSRTFDVTVFGKSNCEKEEIRANNVNTAPTIKSENFDNKRRRIEVDKAIEDAIDIERYVKEKNPYFMTKIKQKNRSKLFVPGEVLRDHKIKLNRKMIILRDPDGKQWLGKVVAWKDGRVWIGGWEAFCKWNNVSEDDRCICELMKGRSQNKISIIQVHIVRS